MVCAVSDLASKSEGEVAVPSAVAMSKLTPPAPAGADSDTVKVISVVPLLPSIWVTSLMLSATWPGPPFGVMLKSSTARPSSAPEASPSSQRMQKLAPLAIDRLPMVSLRAVRLAAALPSLAPVVAVFGVLKFSVATLVQAPVVNEVALRLYSKPRLSARAAVPRRHSSPV